MGKEMYKKVVVLLIKPIVVVFFLDVLVTVRVVGS